jgi:carbonic anhydrase
MVRPVPESDRLIAANEEFASAFDRGELPPPPSLGIVIVTCMDCRIDPVASLGLEIGQAHILRNAGGLITDDVIRSLALSQHKLGTREVVVIQHTNCGLHGLSDEEVRTELAAEAGTEPPFEIGGFDDLERSVRAGMERLRTSPFLPHRELIRGFVYDVSDGRLREVEAR